MSLFSVLIVDDEHDFRDAIVKSLKIRGLECDGASDGESALSMIKKKNYDVIVLDVRMPGRNGVETLKEIKVLSPLVEVVLLTGYASVETSIDGIQSGAFDYLIKPVEFTTLCEKIYSAYERRQVCQAKFEMTQCHRNSSM